MTDSIATPLVLVDGSSYLYRAYHAMYKADLRNSAGHPTGATRTVIAMLKKLKKEYPGSVIAVVFDAKGKTFRDKLFPDYKANRPPMPDDLRVQIEPIHAIVEAMGMPLIMVEGVEADDVIGTFCQQASAVESPVIVSTGDKDMAQLVNEHVALVNTMTDTTMDVAGVKEKFGVAPSQIIDYLALIGDSVDNIPGVPKVGPKTAVKWLDAYGSLQAIMDNADKVSGKVGENLRNTLEQLPLSYQLATIKLDVDMSTSATELKMSEQNKDTLIALFEKYEFSAWLEELSVSDETPKERQVVKTNYDTIFTEAAFESWLEKLKACEYFAFDTETTSLDAMQAKLVGVSFAVVVGEAAYLPFGHDYIDAPEQLSEAFVLGKLKALLEDSAIGKLGQNLKYDAKVLSNYNIELRGICSDTMLESYVYDSTATRHDMDSLALKYLGHETIHYEDVAGKGAKQITFNQVPLETAGPYAAEDADITLRLHQKFQPLLANHPTLLRVLDEMEIPLVAVLTKMELAGTYIDSDMLYKQSAQIQEEIQSLEQHAYELAGEEFNLASPKQLQHIFFDKLKLPIIKKTPKGQPSTAEPVLQELALDYPLPQVIMQHRVLAKLKSTYTDKLPEMINPSTGRVHTSYHQAVAATGRLSSSDPNLQNIPIRTEAGRRVRQAFIAPQGYKILAADYSQIELRIMAHLSNDEGLREAFVNGADVHKATAAEVFSVAVEDVSADQRRNAKAINFGLIYGMSAFGLAKQLGIQRNEAQRYIDQYFARYPGVKHYMDATRAKAAEDGFVETLFGRRLYLSEINASNAMRRQAAERTAINAPMQGTAADIIKKAMLAVDSWIATERADVVMTMQVHDELVFEVKSDECDDVAAHISQLMSDVVDLSVPLLVDVGIGSNWDEAH